MIQMNLFTKQKWTHKHRKQTYDYHRWEGDKLEVWDKNIYTTICKIDNQQGPTV